MLNFTLRPLLVTVFSLFFMLVSEAEVRAQAGKTSTNPAPENQQPAYNKYEQSNQQVAEAYAAVINYLQNITSQQAYHDKNTLTTAQLSWMNYRGNHCQLLSGQPAQGTSGPGNAYYHCITEINNQRLAELKALLTSFEQKFAAKKAQ